MIKRLMRLHLILPEPGGFRRCVGIISRSVNAAAAGPEPRATDFVRIGFRGDSICTRTRRRRTAAEARYRQVKAAPEEMHWARLADKLCAELLENLIAPLQDLPEPAHGIRII